MVQENRTTQKNQTAVTIQSSPIEMNGSGRHLKQKTLLQFSAARICLILIGSASFILTAAPEANATKPTPAANKKSSAKKSQAGDSTDLIYEGYAKVMADKDHVGFVISRYSVDKKTGVFTSTYFLKTSPAAGDVTESLHATAKSSFEPIAYHYTSLVGKQTKTIDARFDGLKMQAQVFEGGKSSTINKSIPKGTFLSTFLPYVMLNGKEGLKPQVNYAYNAVAEEDGGVYPGEAFVKGTETFKNLECFKIMNTFKKEQFVSFVTAGGELLATKAPASGIATELVATFQEATAGLEPNQKTLEVIFGQLPAGQKNIIYKLASQGAPSKEKSQSTPLSKSQGEPDGMMPEGDTASSGSGSAQSLTRPSGKGVDGGASKEKQSALTAEPTAEEAAAASANVNPATDTPKKRGVKGGQGFLIKPGAPNINPAAATTPEPAPKKDSEGK